MVWFQAAPAMALIAVGLAPSSWRRRALSPEDAGLPYSSWQQATTTSGSWCAFSVTSLLEVVIAADLLGHWRIGRMLGVGHRSRVAAAGLAGERLRLQY